MTYLMHNMAKQAGSFFISGGGDFASAAAAQMKVEGLSAILQNFFHADGEAYDGSMISQNDTKKAILFARGKKQSKAQRKVVIGGAKFGLQIAAASGAATVGSIVPGLGTAFGAAGGMVAGLGLGLGVTAADRLKRACKFAYKKALGTAGKHRHEAAMCLLYMASGPGERAGGGNPALEALKVILGEEFDKVLGMQKPGTEGHSAEENTEDGILDRISARMKSN